MKKLAITGAFLLLALSLQTAHATSLPEGCEAGYNYSATTGHPCALPDCNPGDLFSAVDGHRCGGTAYLPGCFSASGYSVTTGNKCDGSTINSAPITTNPTNTVKTNNNTDTNTGASTPAPDQPVNSVPAPLTQEQINNNLANETAKTVRAKYPDAAFYQTTSMPSGRPGTEMIVSQSDRTVILEFWNDNGVLSVHWMDTSLGSN